MKVTVKNDGSKIVSNINMDTGDMGRISSTGDFKGEIVLRAYELLVSLSNLNHSWDADTSPDIEIELFPKGTELILITE